MGIPPELYFAVSVSSCTLTCFFFPLLFVWIGVKTINCSFLSKLGGVSEGFFFHQLYCRHSSLHGLSYFSGSLVLQLISLHIHGPLSSAPPKLLKCLESIIIRIQPVDLLAECYTSTVDRQSVVDGMFDYARTFSSNGVTAKHDN